MTILDSLLNCIQREFIAIPGIGKDIEEVLVGNIKGYTSPRLKDNIRKSLKKYTSSKIFKIISNLIDQNRIIPIFTSKNIIQHFFKRKEYHPIGTTIDNTFFLFIESLYGKIKITSVNEKELVKTVMHELIHIASNTKQTEFININQKILVIFYKEFFIEYLKLEDKIDDDIFLKMIKYQIKAKNNNKINFWKMLLPIFRNLEQYKKTITDNDYKTAFNNLVSFADKSIEKFQKTVPIDIFNAAKKAYKKIGCNTETFSQELWNPFEIISILAQNNPSHPNIFKTIYLLK